MKVDFLDSNRFVIYYFYHEIVNVEEELKVLFKNLNEQLKKRYHYEFRGYYNVTIYSSGEFMIMEFENIDCFGRADFNITMLLNSVFLYEFEDPDLYKINKIYYQNKYFIEFEDVCDSIYLFEYGNIIYGKQVEEVLKKGILVLI